MIFLAKNKRKIDREIALKLCEEIRNKNKKKFISFNKWWCHFCYKFSNTEEKITNRCCLNDENNRGCSQVNKKFDKNYS
jgi:hypothetical protein